MRGVFNLKSNEGKQEIGLPKENLACFQYHQISSLMPFKTQFMTCTIVHEIHPTFVRKIDVIVGLNNVGMA